MATEATTKRCFRCKQVKRLGEFRRRLTESRDGRRSACRECENAARRERDRRRARARNLPVDVEKPRFANRTPPRAPRTKAKTLDELLEAW